MKKNNKNSNRKRHGRNTESSLVWSGSTKQRLARAGGRRAESLLLPCHQGADGMPMLGSQAWLPQEPRGVKRKKAEIGSFLEAEQLGLGAFTAAAQVRSLV